MSFIVNKEEIKQEVLEEVNADKRCEPAPINYNYQPINDDCFTTELNSILLKKFLSSNGSAAYYSQEKTAINSVF